MNYEWLFSFSVFADHMNFTHAAEALHISQPALHVQVKKLSEEVGSTLYRKKGRELRLTEEGRRLAAFARSVQQQGADMLQSLRGQGPRGPVILASGQGAFQYLLGSAIRRFPKHKWPLRSITMAGPEAIESVRDGKSHLAVAVLAQEPDDLPFDILLDAGQKVVMQKSHRLARRKRLQASDLDGEDIIVAPTGRPHRAMLTQALATAGARWQVAVEATGFQLMMQFVRYGMGIAVVNDFCAVPPGCVGVELQGVPSARYYLVRGNHDESDATIALRTLILAQVPG